MENIAKQYFEDMYNFQIVSCGLFIDMEYSFLAASPGKYQLVIYLI